MYYYATSYPVLELFSHSNFISYYKNHIHHSLINLTVHASGMNDPKIPILENCEKTSRQPHPVRPLIKFKITYRWFQRVQFMSVQNSQARLFSFWRLSNFAAFNLCDLSCVKFVRSTSWEDFRNLQILLCLRKLSWIEFRLKMRFVAIYPIATEWSYTVHMQPKCLSHFWRT